VAEHWSGSSWKTVTIPRAGAGTAEEITGIACSSSTSCVAIGTVTGAANPSADYVWDGSTWSVGPSVDASSFHLRGVTCPPGGDCLVVGDYVPFGSTTQFALAAWWGSDLHPDQTVANAGGPGASLARASCPRSTACVAVGQSATHGISAQWNGSGWSATRMPDGIDGFDQPSPVEPADVSCTAATSCVAVGTFPDDARSLANQPVLLTWNGAKWTLTTGIPIDFPVGVSCSSATDCTIAGWDGERSEFGDATAAAAHWNGSQATSDAVAQEPIWLPFFLGIACPAGSGCVAVGGQTVHDGPLDEAQPLMENSVGTTFSLSDTPPPHGPGSAGLNGISCASARNCTVVGSASSPVNEFTYGPSSIPYAAHWNGSQWSARSPARTVGQLETLRAVSCPTSSACVAVGDTAPTGSYQPPNTPIALLWNGTSWTRLAVPSSLSGQWTSVSCVSATHCVALGTGEFEVWNGSTWTAQPQADASDTLYSVSCTGVDACTAVGWNPGPLTVVERWNGTAWTEQSPSAQQPFVAVSCAGAAACQAISVSPVQAMGWDGTSWTNESLSVPGSGTGEIYSDAVDCATVRTCEAVGMITPSGAPFADGWDGVSWNQQALPSSLQNSGLDAVSCPSRTACFAVGSNTTALARYTASPTATTSAPTGVTSTAATLRGTVNPQGATVRSCVFEWGATAAYGHSIPCAQALGSGFASQLVSARVTGLVAGSTYHYRLVLTSSAGGAHGADWVFTTANDNGDSTFGNATIGDGASSFVANIKRANAYRLSEPGSVVDLGVYLEPSGKEGTQRIRGAIYADSFGTPGKLLATTDSLSYSENGAAAWWGLHFAPRLHLKAGRYWLAVLTSGTAGIIGWRYDVVPGSRDYNTDDFSAGFSDPFGPVTHDDFQMSLYADYVPDGSGSAARAPAAHATTSRFRARTVSHERPGRVR
jgi:hypothetical protein